MISSLDLYHPRTEDMITTGTQVVFGVKPTKPIVNIPDGCRLIKVKLRSNQLATMFIKTPEGVRLYCVKENPETWEPFSIIGENYKPNPIKINKRAIENIIEEVARVITFSILLAGGSIFGAAIIFECIRLAWNYFNP